MKDIEVAEIEKSLRHHENNLELLLKQENPILSDVYLLISGQLRVLLCDTDKPILLEYSKYKNIQLYVWGPRPFPISVKGTNTTVINFKVANWLAFEPHSHKYKIEDFLDTPIGYQPISIQGNSETRPYSPRQLIKWVSNKDGVSHLDFRKPQTFRKIKDWKYNSEGVEYEDGLVRKYILQIGEWAYHAIRDLKSNPSDASFVVRLKLRKIPNKEVPFFLQSSTSLGISVVCFATTDRVIFRVVQGSIITAEVDARYPDKWRIGSDALFVLLYNSESRSISTLTNKATGKAIDEVNLNGIADDEKGGRLLPGFSEYFSGNITIFGRRITTADVAEILSLPTNWKKAAEENKNAT